MRDGSSARRLRIAIATLGRFHVLDLARELAALGHEVRFYSWVPRARAIRFGLPRECHVSLLVFLFPLAALQRVWPRAMATWLEYPIYRAANLAVRLRLQPCDVFIGMSGLYLEAAVHARERFGALILLERGSRHILSQRDILDALPGKARVPEFAIRRELAGYALADRVVVPSNHVVRSFTERGHPECRLMRNPYGVDLQAFKPVPKAASETSSVLYVGVWSFQKGVDVLMEAMTRLTNVQLLHVGAPGDAMRSPADSGVRHVGPVDQRRLPEYYAKADIFVLPSRQEGLALVLLQALACGLPVVCTDRTGGEDLRELIDHPEAIQVVPAGDADALAQAIRTSLQSAPRLRGTDLLGRGRQTLSWQAYGARYDAVLQDLVTSSKADV